jgi:hypothetical protein
LLATTPITHQFLTPFFLNYGRHPRMPFATEIERSTHPHVPAASDFAAGLQETLKRAKKSLQSAQDRQQAFYNRNRPEITYHPNQLVLLSTQNFSQERGQKLMPKWMGPFRVIKMVGPVAVNLDLLGHIRCHNVFHVSQVELYRIRDGEEPVPLMTLMALQSGNWNASFTTGLSQFRRTTGKF